MSPATRKNKEKGNEDSFDDILGKGDINQYLSQLSSAAASNTIIDDNDIKEDLEDEEEFNVKEQDSEIQVDVIDDDKDSLDDWIQEDDEFINDNEITNLLDESAKKRREKFKSGGQDELERDFEEFENNLALTTGIGAKRIKGDSKKRLLAGELRLSDEVKRKLGEANALYIQRDYGHAIDILQAVITDHPNAHPAWNTLGLVHEELGNKAKSLQLRMVAAHMCNDSALWKELAQKSIENDAIKQAIYCFTKALVIDPTDVDSLWDRSFLFKQIDRSSEAVDGFTKILEIMPHHFKVINELTQIYRTSGKTKEAIQMYEDAIVYHTAHEREDSDDEEEEEEEDNEFLDKLGYSEINMLSELYLILNDYRRCLDTIKTGLRIVQKRQNESWWEDRADDDDEYLEEKNEARTDFPIELRVRMGVCRVYLNQVRVATNHFQYLLQYPPTTYPDLHQDIAYAYYDRRHYDLALSVFQRIIDVSDEIDVDLLIRTADCYRELGNLDTAVVFYVNVLEEQPENLDIMMSLATVYEEQGKEEEALELVNFVMKKNREARKARTNNRSNKNNDDEIENDEESVTVERLNKARAAKKAKSKKASILDEEQHNHTNMEKAQMRREEHQRREEEMDFSTRALFEKLDELDSMMGERLLAIDRTMMRDYMRSAHELWEDFSNTTAFYPSERTTRYAGFYALRRGRKKVESKNLNVQARHMHNRLQTKVKTEDRMDIDIDLDEEERQLQEEEDSEIRMAAAAQFRNVPFDKWLRVFIKYAYMLAMTRRTEDAYALLKRAIDANVFFHDVQKKTALYVTLIGCGMINYNDGIVQEGARWLCNFYQFRNDPFRIYVAVENCGRNDRLRGTQTQLKYLARMVRLMDAIIASKQSCEQSELDEIRELDEAILAMNVDPNSHSKKDYYKRFYQVPDIIGRKTIEKMGITAPAFVNPLLLSLFGQFMSMSKNHLAASVFFIRSYAIAPKNALNTLCLSIGLVHAAMQRRTDNRHLQIMQGMMFLYEYAELRGNCQEVEYNIARMFHVLGLTHLAVPHYEKVLCLPSKAKANIEKEKPSDQIYNWPPSEEETDEEEEEEDETDLKHEAAYNLHLIYVTSGSMALAQILLLKYCSI